VWIDENDVAHTVWVPPAQILGEEAVAALGALPQDVAAAAIAALDAEAMTIRDDAAADAPRGPTELEEADLDELPDAPEFPGLAPRDDEPLATTVLRYLSEVPAQWRVEALEAVYDVLEGPGDDET